MFKRIVGFENYAVDESGVVVNTTCTMKQYILANVRKRRAIKQIDYRSGKLLNVFQSIREASRSTGIPSSNIVCVLKGRQTRTKDFSWCYVEELS